MTDLNTQEAPTSSVNHLSKEHELIARLEDDLYHGYTKEGWEIINQKHPITNRPKRAGDPRYE